MVVLEVGLVAQAHHMEGRGDGAFPWRENRSNQQNLGMLPDTLGKQGRKAYNHMQHFERQGEHGNLLLAEGRLSRYPAFRFVVKKPANGQSRAQSVFKKVP
jgi:hypothetical protein